MIIQYITRLGMVFKHLETERRYQKVSNELDELKAGAGAEAGSEAEYENKQWDR